MGNAASMYTGDFEDYIPGGTAWGVSWTIKIGPYLGHPTTAVSTNGAPVYDRSVEIPIFLCPSMVNMQTVNSWNTTIEAAVGKGGLAYAINSNVAGPLKKINRLSSTSVLLGHPIVAKGHKALLNQVSRTSLSCTQPLPSGASIPT